MIIWNGLAIILGFVAAGLLVVSVMDLAPGVVWWCQLTLYGAGLSFAVPLAIVSWLVGK